MLGSGQWLRVGELVTLLDWILEDECETLGYLVKKHEPLDYFVPVGWTPTLWTRDTPIPTRVLYAAMQRSKYIEHENGEAIDWSNFVDLDWISSSANSCEELLGRSMLSASPTAVLSSDNVINEMARETTSSVSECGSSSWGRVHTGSDLRYGEAQKTEVVKGFSDTFVHWVMDGETLYH